MKSPKAKGKKKVNPTPEWDSWRGVRRSSLKQIEIAWHLALVPSFVPLSHTYWSEDGPLFPRAVYSPGILYLAQV